MPSLNYRQMAIIIAVMAWSLMAFPSEINFCPAWVGQGPGQLQSNSSYLSNFNKDLSAEEFRIRDRIFDSEVTTRLKGEYLPLIEKYEYSRTWDRLDRAAQKAHELAIEELTGKTMRHIIDRQQKATMVKAAKHSEEIRIFKKVQNDINTTIDNVGKSEVQIAPQFTFGTYANWKDQIGTGWMRSNYINGDANLYMQRDFEIAPGGMKLLSKTEYSELFDIKLNRGLPIIDATAESKLGGTTTKLTHSIRKQLTSNLFCTLSAEHGLSREHSGIVGVQEKIEFGYELHY